MITFNGVTGRALTSALESLSESTRLTVQVGGVEYHGERLRSPHLTHQTATVSVSPDAPASGVLLSNGRYTVYAIGPAIPPAEHRPDPPAGYVWSQGHTLASEVLGVVGRLADIAPGLAAACRRALVQVTPASSRSGAPARHSVLATVYVAMRELAGWDEDGRPVFVEVPETEPEPDTLMALAGITEATFSPEDEPPVPADDDPEPEPEG